MLIDVRTRIEVQHQNRKNDISKLLIALLARKKWSTEREEEGYLLELGLEAEHVDLSVAAVADQRLVWAIVAATQRAAL